MSIHQTKPHLLVIGGTGFIGYHLISAAKKKGWKVTSVSIHKPQRFRYIKKVEYLNINICNFKKLKKKLNKPFSHVVNLGGYIDHGPYENDKAEEINKNHFIGVINLTKIFLHKNIKKFVQIGSSVEYGQINSPQTENFSDIPDSYYSLSKLASTQFLLMLYKNYKFPTTILRLFQVYGPGQDRNRFLPQVIKGCIENRKFPVSKGEQVRDFCHVDDVVRAIFLALTSSKSNGEIFNIGLGKPIKIKKIIKLLCKIIGKGSPMFGKVKYRKYENMKLYPSITKAKSKLRWKPKLNFNQGINLVISSYK